MRKIVVSSMISIDGYTEGAGGDVMAMPMDQPFSENNVERVRAAGRLLFGGTTYRGMMQYWPAQVDNPDASPDDRYIASRYAGGLPITVVSDTVTRDDITVWGDQTTIVRRADAHAEIERLRSEGDGASTGGGSADALGRDILIFGSRTLWTDLLAHGLVDELFLMIGPRVVGGDHRAFAGLAGIDLTLLDVRSWQNSGTVLLHYAAANAR